MILSSTEKYKNDDVRILVWAQQNITDLLGHGTRDKCDDLPTSFLLKRENMGTWHNHPSANFYYHFIFSIILSSIVYRYS